MTYRLGALAAALLLTTAVPPTAVAKTPSSTFMGHWRVAGVAVSDSGVQALSDNDPTLVGKRLTFTSTMLGWDQTPSTGDACNGPNFTGLNEAPPPELRQQLRKLGMGKVAAYAVHCHTGSWGPGATTVYLDGAGRLALPWYDGGLLKLVRG